MSLCQWLSSRRDQALLADLPERRRWAYLSFSGALFLTLASHTFVGPVKTSVFMDLVGTDKEPIAKSLTLVVLFPVTVLYSMAVSVGPRYLVSGVCLLYAVAFTFVTLGLGRAAHSGVPEAWVLYYAYETSGVIIMPMLWSVIADVTPPDVAPKAFPAIFFVVQLGGILGSVLSIQVSSLGGKVGLLIMQIVCFLLIAALSWCACTLVADPDGETTPLLADAGRDARLSDAEGLAEAGAATAPAPIPEQSKASKASEPGTPEQRLLASGLQGLWLLLSRPYVFGIFWVSYATLVPRTVLDYSNSVLVVQSFEEENKQIQYFGQINLMINCGTALLTLLGTRPIVERFGVGRSLLVLPFSMGACILALCIHYSLDVSTIALVVACIVAYGLNSPCKEMLYVRTSREIKYKAKSWSEWYGNQAMKLLGAQVNLWINQDSKACQPHCFHPGVTGAGAAAWIALWAAVAYAVGSKHRALEAEDGIVT